VKPTESSIAISSRVPLDDEKFVRLFRDGWSRSSLPRAASRSPYGR